MDNSHPAPKAPLGYGRISATQSNKNTISTSLLTWEKGRHLATLSPVPRHLRNERRNSILMTRHYPDLGSASDWLNQISHAARPIRSDALSVWNFCVRFSDVIWRGNQWQRRQMSAVFSGLLVHRYVDQHLADTRPIYRPTYRSTSPTRHKIPLIYSTCRFQQSAVGLTGFAVTCKNSTLFLL